MGDDVETKTCRTQNKFGCMWPYDMNFRHSDYFVQSAYCKQQQIWMKIIEDDTPGQFFDGLFSISFFLQNINLAFDFVGDEMPPNRVKVIHPTGTCALFEFVVTTDDNPYTGSLKGTKYGILRISEVGTVSPDMVPSTSMGLKFLRDGVDAGNMFSLHAFEGHATTFNFLKPVYHTHVTLPENECNLETSHAKLSQVSKHVGNMSVKGLSDFDQYGVWEPEPAWPFRCELRPNDPCDIPDHWERSYLEQLTDDCIPIGYNLFDMWCMEAPEELGGVLRKIGEIRTTSEMVTSLYGDTRLFFRHVRFEEDLEAKPEWRPFVQTFVRSTFVNNLPLSAEAPAHCPFEYLYGLM